MSDSNVTEADLVRYAEVFHTVLTETAAEFLPEDVRKDLLHLSLLPAQIICFVSTNFGVGFEYLPAETTRFTSQHGSIRIEDMFTRAPRSISRERTVLPVVKGNCGVYDLTLEGGFPFRLADNNASLTIRGVRFKAGDWVREVSYAELYGDRRASQWSEAEAVSRAKNEVLAALTELHRAHQRQLSISEYVANIKQKTVLVLGSYDRSGRERIRLLAQALTEIGYDPLVIDEIPDHPEQSLPQKVTTLGSLARFVVVDDSEPSGHIAELEICKTQQWTTLILRRSGVGSSWMTAGSSLFSTVILETSYEPPPVAEAISNGARWAEEKIGEIESGLAATYPWRRKAVTE